MRGFTLLEMMIVLAIIGILAAMALPSYERYLNKTHATTALIALAPLKLQVTEYALLHPGKLDTLNDQSIHLNPQTFIAHHAQIIQLSVKGGANQALIMATLSEHLGSIELVGRYQSGSGQLYWQCQYPKSSPMAQHAPSSCQANQT